MVDQDIENLANSLTPLLHADAFSPWSARSGLDIPTSPVCAHDDNTLSQRSTKLRLK